MTDRPLPPDTETFLAELTTLLVQGGSDDALRRAVRWLAHLSRARAAAIYLFDKSRPAGHFFHADDRAVGAELEPQLADTALQAEQRAAPVNAAWGSGGKNV